MGGKMDIEKKKCKTPQFRVSFPHVFEKNKFEDGAESYSLVCVFDKKTDLKEMKRAAWNAAKEKWGDDKKMWPDPKVWPKKIKRPFRDGDEDKPDDPVFENSIFVTPTSKKNRPQILDQKTGVRITEEEDFYAGCYAKAVLIAFAYENKGNRGVSFALQGLLKTADGEKLGGGRPVEDEFADEVEQGSSDSSDDPESYEEEEKPKKGKGGF